MTVLVACATKHGSTFEIADAIGRTLGACGLETDVRRIGHVSDLGRYDAVVLGSAVYAGNWLEPARTFADRHADQLAARPTWFFSSGPIGDPPRPAEDRAVDIDPIVARISPREHRVFAGKIDKSKLGFAERAVVFAFGAPEGDFRDWAEIEAWASAIAETLMRE